MADRLYYDLEIALSSYSNPTHDDYDDEEEETDGEFEVDEVNAADNEQRSEDLACPFCLEDFDVLGFCCHIDADHRLEVKPGICPMCSSRVGINMVSHMITHHESVLKALCTKKQCSSRSRSAILLLRKELQDKHLQNIREAPSTGSSSNAAADTKLLSFVNNRQPSLRSQTVKTTTVTDKTCEFDSSDRIPAPSSVATTDKNDEISKCEFVQGLLMSTILDDF